MKLVLTLVLLACMLAPVSACGLWTSDSPAPVPTVTEQAVTEPQSVQSVITPQTVCTGENCPVETQTVTEITTENVIETPQTVNEQTVETVQTEPVETPQSVETVQTVNETQDYGDMLVELLLRSIFYRGG